MRSSAVASGRVAMLMLAANYDVGVGGRPRGILGNNSSLQSIVSDRDGEPPAREILRYHRRKARICRWRAIEARPRS